MSYEYLNKAYKLDNVFFVSNEFKNKEIDNWVNVLISPNSDFSLFDTLDELKQYIFNDIINNVKKENNGIIENHFAKFFNRNFDDINTVFEHITNGIVNVIILKSRVYKQFRMRESHFS